MVCTFAALKLKDLPLCST